MRFESETLKARLGISNYQVSAIFFGGRPPPRTTIRILMPTAFGEINRIITRDGEESDNAEGQQMPE